MIMYGILCMVTILSSIHTIYVCVYAFNWRIRMIVYKWYGAYVQSRMHPITLLLLGCLVEVAATDLFQFEYNQIGSIVLATQKSF